MRHIITASLMAIGLLCTTGLSQADTLTTPAPGQQVGQPDRPVRGMSMAAVEKAYGEPLQKLAPVPAKGTPKHPPITRWIYPKFVVYFEYNHVIHTVLKDNPGI